MQRLRVRGRPIRYKGSDAHSNYPVSLTRVLKESDLHARRKWDFYLGLVGTRARPVQSPRRFLGAGVIADVQFNVHGEYSRGGVASDQALVRRGLQTSAKMIKIVPLTSPRKRDSRLGSHS